MNRLATQFLADLAGGSGDAAKTRFRRAVRDRAGLKRAYSTVLLPCQKELYRLHAEGVLGSLSTLVAGVVICHEIMNEFAGLVFSTPARGIRTLVVNQPGEVHDLHARVIADILQLEGFDTRYLSGVTETEIEHELQSYSFDLLLISVHSPARLEAAGRLRDRAWQLRPGLRVILGGQALASAPAEPLAPLSHAGHVLQSLLGFPRRSSVRRAA